jgi:phosphoserine aminotransferase
MQGISPSKARSQNRHNFSGGPGALPDPVLEQARDAIIEVPGVGVSVLGISHRSQWFRNVVDEVEENFRTLLGLRKDYRVLFLQGGGSLQFSMIPMSFLRGRRRPADYVVSGYWSGRAIPDAQREGSVRVIWDGHPTGYTRLPADLELEYAVDAPYLHYVSNETVEGLQFHRLLGTDRVPRICDMSSDLLSRPVDANRFSMIYAHAQKNLGPAGVTVVILHGDLLKRLPNSVPPILDYRVHNEHGSIYNTPPVFAIYVTMLVTRWLRDAVGGLTVMEDINRAKAASLYARIDSSNGFYVGRVFPADRSWMNVTFNIHDRKLEPDFVREAEAAGFQGLQGHRSVGGLRASLYNAVTIDAVRNLTEFMEDFRLRHV